MRSKILFSVPRSAFYREDLTHACAVQPSDKRAASLRAERRARIQTAAVSPVPVSATTPDAHRHKASISIKHTRFGDTRTLVRKQGKRLAAILRLRYVTESDVFSAGELSPSRPVASYLECCAVK